MGTVVALWSLALWYVADVLVEDPDDPAERVRAALAVGVGLGFLLGLVGLLGAPALLVATLALVVFRRVRSPGARRTARPSGAHRTGLAIVLAAVVALAWPALVRPLLEGDSLGYHLPNAATWAQTGSIWNTSTRYWWYPGGSELFAADVFALGGRFALGLSGAFALALFGLRVWVWGRRLGLSSPVAGLTGAATMATLTIGLQAGNLLNDVWLGAFFLESLYAGRYKMKSAVPLAVCALLKPYGVLLALIAGFTFRLRPRALVLATLPLAVWLLHDAALWNGALIPPGSTHVPYWPTTIVANGWPALSDLARALWGDGLWTVGLALVALGGALFARERRLALAALAAFILFACLPFSYRNDLSQLATGESLRFAIPAFAAATVVGIGLLRRFPLALGAVAALAFAFEVRRITGIFWIDPTTHAVYLVAAAALAIFLIPITRLRALTASVAYFVAVIFTGTLAAKAAVPRYNEWLGAGVQTDFFGWLTREQPPRIVVSDVAAGAVLIVSPATRVYDVLDALPCDQAQALKAALVYRRVPPPDKTIYPSAVQQFERCGPSLFDDRVVRVVRGGLATRPGIASLNR